MANVDGAADLVWVVDGDGEAEHTGRHTVVAVVVVAEVAGDLVDVQADDGEDPGESVTEGLAGQHQIGWQLEGAVVDVVGIGDHQNAVVVFDDGGDGQPGGSFGVRAGDQVVQQPRGDGGRCHEHSSLPVRARPAMSPKLGMPR